MITYIYTDCNVPFNPFRAAAIRCREKKKKWIENLSMKYDELGSINQKLQTEVSSLRSEVAVLKSMLLQHKDCPVTLAMQGGVCVCLCYQYSVTFHCVS